MQNCNKFLNFCQVCTENGIVPKDIQSTRNQKSLGALGFQFSWQ